MPRAAIGVRAAAERRASRQGPHPADGPVGAPLLAVSARLSPETRRNRPVARRGLFWRRSRGSLFVTPALRCSVAVPRSRFSLLKSKTRGRRTVSLQRRRIPGRVFHQPASKPAFLSRFLRGPQWKQQQAPNFFALENGAQATLFASRPSELKERHIPQASPLY
jgi:hypothetical protein